MSSELRHSAIVGGIDRGRKIFKTVFEIIEPKVIIVHGSGTVKELEKSFRMKFPKPPDKDARKPVEAKLGRTAVFVIPSLAPPEFNKWSSWRNKHLEDVCRAVAARLG